MSPSANGAGRTERSAVALCVLVCAGAPARVGPLHGAAPSTPVPHWVVLLAVVPALWLVIGGLVVAADRLLRRLGV